jgi:hypothetical protein
MIMSRIGSSSGVRVAAAPLSNVYTVLLLIGALVLILVLTALWITTNQKYGVILGVSDEGKTAMQAPDLAKAAQTKAQVSMDQWASVIKDFKPVPTLEEAKAAAEAKAAGAGAATATSTTGDASAAPAPAVTGTATPTGSAL